MSDYALFNPAFKGKMQADIQTIRNDAPNKNDPNNKTNDCLTYDQIKRSMDDGALGAKGSDSYNAWQDVLNHFKQIDVTANGRAGNDNLINWDDISHFDLGTA